MFWADKIAKEIVDSGKYKPYWVDDMKTPSGRVHVGSLRGVLVHNLIYQALVDVKAHAIFSYVFDDHDPMDGLPTYLDKEIWGQHLGKPLFTIPSPDGKAENYGRYYAQEFIDVFHSLGCDPKIFWTSELYKQGKMNDGIRACLDHIDVIKSIYESQYKKSLASDWYPFQVRCPGCGKLSTTKVTKWDGQDVHFSCRVDAVDWTVGCGYSGITSPFSGEGQFVGKLSWKVEWAVKWQVIGITVEGAGKDHMTAGGSHDITKRVVTEVLHYPVPYGFSHEFFLIGGKKMSSSKGLGTSAKEISDILPANLLRFLFVRTDYRQAIEFDPIGTMAIPDLFDEYDRCWRAYVAGDDQDLARTFELSQIDTLLPKTEFFLPRFRDVANYIQLPNVNLVEHFAKEKGSTLTGQEQLILEERKKYATIWVQTYAPEEYRFRMTPVLPSEVSGLTKEQREYLADVILLVQSKIESDDLQLKLYETAKIRSFDSKKAFAAVYIALLGKIHGPKAGWLLRSYSVEAVVERLRQASEIEQGATSSVAVTTISRPEYFAIDPVIKNAFPSVSIGIALIKNVNVVKTDPDLEKEKNELLSHVSALTTEQIGQYPEVVSYRKLYKEMGVDWHSRRPSPEALLRRVALGKGLYSVNTCVDAYNLVVMKYRVSVGAFDADLIRFPTTLRFAGEGNMILLLGDSEPIIYSAKELAYYDQEGGYNIDFNFRDAQRTKVTEQTKNIWINVDGVYEITSEQVQKSLEESVSVVTKYCGGKVEFMGIVT